MAISIEYYSAAVTSVASGILIPVADLPGLLAADLEAADTDKESKVIKAILNKINNQLTFALAAAKPLGFAMALGVPVNAGTDLFNLTYSITETRMGNLGTNTLSSIPLPTSGQNSGRGGMQITTVFPGASKIVAGSFVVPGILIPSSALTLYGSPDYAATDLTTDSRRWFTGLIGHIINNATKRSSVNASGIIAAAKGAATVLTPPPSFTDATNPTTGVIADDLPLRVFVTSSYSINLQVYLNSSMAAINNVTG